MREQLAPLAFRRHYYTATVGPRGSSPGGRHVCLRDLRCAETGEPLAEHVWAPLPRHDLAEALVIGRRVRFRATVRPYARAGGGGADYHLTGLRHIEAIAGGGTEC